jgi:chromosomal replication initiation ATPase DnaA
MTIGRQLALPFGFTAHYDAASFLEDDSNAAARAWLDAPWPEGRLALWGGGGSGKTHLLHVWTARTGAIFMPGPGLRTSMLQGLLETPAAGGLAVDDADHAPEEPLLQLLNAAREAGRPVLLAAREAPSRWHTALPDLASRLRATAAVALDAPDDAMLRALLARLLAERLAVPQAIQDWMLLRLPRHPAALREAAARLDRAALAAGGGVTRVLAEAVVEAVVEAEG